MLISKRQEFTAKFLGKTVLVLLCCGVVAMLFVLRENYNFDVIPQGSYIAAVLLLGSVLGSTARDFLTINLIPKRQLKVSRSQQSQVSEATHSVAFLCDEFPSLDDMSVDTPSFPLNGTELEAAMHNPA